jgi:hypothetical protein
MKFVMEMYHLNEDQVLEELIQMEINEQFHYELQSNLNSKKLFIIEKKIFSFYTLKLIAGHDAAGTMAKRPSPPSFRTLNSHTLRPPTSQ